MKSIARQCLPVLFAAAAVLGHAPAGADELKIGFVNTDRIFREANTAKSAQAKLEQEFSRREKELADMGTSLKTASPPLK